MADKFQLPARASRGKRMRAAIEEQEDAADTDFWNQSFFAEEANDDDYQLEVEEEDVPDSDFDDPEEEASDSEDAEDAAEKPKRKVLKAPEPKGPPKVKASKPPKSEVQPGDELQANIQKVDSSEPLEPVVYAAPTLRRSTMAKVAFAEMQRQERQEKVRPVRPKSAKASDWRPMSQAELLAEAARTAVDNTHSLRQLLAMEEETKRKATIVKHVYRGAIVKWVSRSRRCTLPPPPPPQSQSRTDVFHPSSTAGTVQQPGAAARLQHASGAQDTAPNQPNGLDVSSGAPGTLCTQPEEAAAPGSLATDQAAQAPQPLDDATTKAARDDTVYEATLTYELHNLSYPPVWLRRWRAHPPPTPLLSQATQTIARYRDPFTGLGFNTAPEFRKLRGLPANSSRSPTTVPTAAAALPTTRGFNASTCLFPGMSQAQGVSAHARRALAVLPPEPAPPAPPSLQLTAVPPGTLSPAMMAMVVELAGSTA